MKRTANGGAEETTARQGRGGQDGAENQYEITLARASAKLQVIKRADKQMKQREARGAASPRRRGLRGEEQKEREDRRGARRERERIEAEERNGEGAHLGRKANTRPSRRRTSERAEKTRRAKNGALTARRNKLRIMIPGKF